MFVLTLSERRFPEKHKIGNPILFLTVDAGEDGNTDRLLPFSSNEHFTNQKLPCLLCSLAQMNSGCHS